MSTELVRLMGRAVADSNIREALLANPSAVLGAFNITKEESKSLLAGLENFNANFSAAQLNNIATECWIG